MALALTTLPMSQIISEEAMTAAVVNELRTGRQFLDSLQEMRERDARSVAADFRKAGRKRGHQLKHVAEVPQREYLQMIHKYGHECWEDREFVRDFQKLEPDLAGAYRV